MIVPLTSIIFSVGGSTSAFVHCLTEGGDERWEVGICGRASELQGEGFGGFLLHSFIVIDVSDK